MDGLNEQRFSIDSEESKAEQTRAEDDAALVEEAQECYRVGLEADAAWREEASKDLDFLAGDQWAGDLKALRESQKRPALTVNRLPQFVRQVTNEQRQSKPSVNVKPVDSGSDPRTAEVLQGVIRNIEVSSNADAAYASGGQSAAITGKGYWDVGCEYESETSFEQRIVVRRIPNPMSVLMDPSTKELAGDDARWAILDNDISKREFKAKWPDATVPGGSGWASRGNTPEGWVTTDGVRIHEYRYIKETPDTLIADPEGGEPILASQLADMAAQIQEETTGVPVSAEEREELAKQAVERAESSGLHMRPTARRKACWVKIAGDEVLERGEFVGSYLQLVRVVGTELSKDGETIYEGVIRHARDPQKILNLMVSAEAESIGLMPKSPWLATPRQIEGYEDQWEHANQRAASYLPYNPDPLAPPPQRIMAEPNVSAITNARLQAADDLKAVTGIYDAALGARSNESSGKAILARESQGQTSNFHYQDNLGMAMRYTGRIYLDLIPKVYTGPRVLRILGEDGQHEMVPVNGMQDDSGAESVPLNAGRYDVTVSMGPSYQSRRQEAVAMLMELARVDPAIPAATRDLLVKSMDMPGGTEIAKRLEKTLPPEIRPPDKEQPPAQMLAMQLQQAQQENQQLIEALNATSADLRKAAEEIESKERIEMTKLRVQLALKIADIESTESLEMLKAERASLAQRQQLTGFNEPIEGANAGG